MRPHPRAGRATRLVIAYLLATSVPLISHASAGERGSQIAVMHLAALTAALGAGWSARRGPRWRSALDWLPLAAIPLLYLELPYVIAGVGSAYRDGIVQGWEHAIFGRSPARVLAGQFPSALLSSVLHAGYLSYYVIIYGPPLVLYLRGRREEFSKTVTGLLCAFVLCYVVFALFPVEGPRYLWPPPLGIPSGGIRSLTLRLLEAGSSRGTAFPSSHVAVAAAQSVMALCWQRRIGMATSIATVALAIGAVYGGFHYGVDVAAGAVIGVMVGAAAVALQRGHARSTAVCDGESSFGNAHAAPAGPVEESRTS
jgi:PAP2 superfamily